MALFPTEVLAKENVKARWKERYTSEAMNKKFLGIPNGVYLGFEPNPNPGDTVNLLDLNLDSTQSVSVLRAKSLVSQTTVDLIVEQQITLDFTGHVAFPVYVFAEVSYKVGEETTGEIKTSTTAPNGLTQIGICKITAPDIGGATLGVPHLQFDPENAPDRHAPIANTGVAFGFMTGGAEQDRQAAAAAVIDIDNAKTDTLSVVHPTLTDRLTADFGTTQLGSRLGKNIISLRSNDETGVTGSSINVSNSFTGAGRTAQPAIDIPGGGSESINGVIAQVTASVGAATSDTDRNIVAIQDVNSGRPYADPSTGRPVFGRLAYDEVADGAINFTFTDGSVVVAVAGGDPTILCNDGDAILDPEGNYYPISRTPGSVGLATITLDVAWNRTNPVGPLVTTLQRRRYTLDFFTREGGVESPYSVVRQAFLDVPSWIGSGFGLLSPQTPEPYSTDAGATQAGVIVRQSFNGDDSILYVPDDPADILLSTDTINEVGGVTKQMVPAAGTPTQPAPDLRFFFPVFQPVDQSRSDQKPTMLQAPTILIPRASENFDGLTRFAAIDTGVERFTALQANDGRVLTLDQAAAAAAAASPSGANPFITNADFQEALTVARAHGSARYQCAGTFAAAGPPAHTNYTWNLLEQDHNTTLGSIVVSVTNGIITFRRPPAGYRFYIDLMAWANNTAGGGNPSTDISSHVQNDATVRVRGFGFHGASGAGGFTNCFAGLRDMIIIDEVGISAFPVAYELWFGGTNTPNLTATFMTIGRSARAV